MTVKELKKLLDNYQGCYEVMFLDKSGSGSYIEGTKTFEHVANTIYIKEI